MTTETPLDSTRPQLAVYYFDNWHEDARQQQWMGEGWTEWDLVRRAKPRFPGHHQPKRPLWGFTDDTRPEDFERAAAAACDAGIDAFIVDWYWYQDQPFLEGPLNQSILPSDSPLKFALMWANHEWTDVFPQTHGHRPRHLASPAVNGEGFRSMTQRIIERYMTSPRYWRIDGAAYFSIFQIDGLIESLGGREAAREAFADFRNRAASAGVGELHLAVVTSNFEPDSGMHDYLAALGIDSANDYWWPMYDNWYAPGMTPSLTAQSPTIPYAELRRAAESRRDAVQSTIDVPYAPTVDAGWDSTPRTVQDETMFTDGYPYLPVVVDDSPEELEVALRNALAYARQHNSRYLTVYAWNEWTEGSFLMPDEQYGTGRLNAVRAVFGSTQMPTTTPGRSRNC